MWLIQSAISSVGMKSLQGGCVLMCIVMVLCGSFVPLLFHVPLFWSKSHTLQKTKTKQKYLHINISHRVAAEDGNQDLTRGELSMDKKMYRVNMSGMEGVTSIVTDWSNQLQVQHPSSRRVL